LSLESTDLHFTQLTSRETIHLTGDSTVFESGLEQLRLVKGQRLGPGLSA